MSIAGGYFRVTVTQGILDHAKVFGLLIKVRAATVTENMASLTGVLKTCDIEGFVHDVAQAVAGNAAQFVVVRIRQDKGGEGALLFYGLVRRYGIEISLENVKGFSTGINGVQPPGSTFASYHDNFDVPADVLSAKSVNLDVAEAFYAHEIQDKYVAVTDKRVRLLVEEITYFSHLLLTIEVQQVMGGGAGHADLLAGIVIDKTELLGCRKKGSYRHESRVIGAGLVIFVDKVLTENTHLVVSYSYGMNLVFQAPADEVVNPGTIGLQSVAAGIAVGNISGQEFDIVLHKVLSSYDL